MDVYEQLREILDTHPSGAPKSAAFDKILRILFTPDEASLAVHMSFAPKSIESIARAAGIEPVEAEKTLENLANKAIIFCRDKSGERSYALLPTIPGLFEFPLMKGGGTPETDELGKLWEEYHHDGLSAAFSGSPTPVARVVPVNKSIEPKDRVHPYEEIAKMIEDADYIAVTQCACRVSIGKCDAPKDVCMIFGPAARFLVSRGFGREVDKKEGLETLDRAEKAGLLHTSNNSSDRANFICNCCPCCCTILRGRTSLNLPHAFATSPFEASVDEGECTGCGVCAEERCPMGAIEMRNDVAVVYGENCIGCGLCVTECPTEAIKLVRRLDQPEISSNIREMGLKVAKEKGKLETFIKIMQR